MTTATVTTSTKELRQFAFMMAGMFILVFGLFFPWLWSYSFPAWPWIFGVIFIACGLIKADALAPIYKAWMKFADVLGWINTRVILITVFYAMILPLGLGMRLIGKDPMGRRLDQQIKTYRRTITTARTAADLEKPF